MIIVIESQDDTANASHNEAIKPTKPKNFAILVACDHDFPDAVRIEARPLD